ncbi:hypothetical protein DRQ12_12030 [candidate division KSB1 bacterium]|nr:MAG: hypothetical protein DRQ12_12030 [candidate division KSB1 bacterium]
MDITQNEMKNSRKIISSPIPAMADATREVGNGGCGILPSEWYRDKIISAPMKNTPRAAPISPGIRNRYRLVTRSSQISAKPNLREKVIPINPKPP